MLATLLIVFREVIEAGLIVAIVLAATKGVTGRGLWVSYGVLGGLAGAAVVAAFAGQLGALFEGAGQELFNAVILLVAVIMLGWHNVWMASHGRALAQEMKEVGAAVSSGQKPLAPWPLSAASPSCAKDRRWSSSSTEFSPPAARRSSPCWSAAYSGSSPGRGCRR